ncbi:MAG TPA: alpha-amylase family glycosyl hydrolase [Steroidobacteraceae bacterium]
MAATDVPLIGAAGTSASASRCHEMMSLKWWQRGVIYQIYPRSFQDTNGDGIGDLAGIRQRLEHCASLGVDAVWLSPIYPSPLADFGYDVSDYTGVHPVFGTLGEFDQLVLHAGTLGLRIILDYVPNHTSDQHPWFAASRSSRSSSKRDWYLWRDPAPEGGPPNNWLSQFGGSAWEWDPHSGQYYYHAFLKEQPDLNWRNPEVRSAMYEVLRFWMRRGVAGFRVDVLWHLIKDDQWRDNPPNPQFRPGDPPSHSQIPLYNTDRPEVQALVAEMRSVVDEFADRVLIGEIYLPVERLVAYYGTRLDGVHLPFNFHLLQTSWNAKSIASLIDMYERSIPPGGWPNWVLGNHDNPRIASRVGSLQARVAAMLLLTLRGTPTMYYGDELGMTNTLISPERTQDCFEKRVPGLGLGRDPARTPMQWTAQEHAGFSTAEPWLPVSDDYPVLNVESEQADHRSILLLYRKLLALRRSHAALTEGSYEPVSMTGDLLAYVRRSPYGSLLIALNLGKSPFTLLLASLSARGQIILSTHLDQQPDTQIDAVALRPSEGVIVQLIPSPG